MLKDVGTTYGLVGCIDSLRIQGTGRDHEYDLMYPASQDIDDGWHIGKTTYIYLSSLIAKPAVSIILAADLSIIMMRE